MKLLSALSCLLVFALSATTANAVLVTATFDASFEADLGPIDADGLAGIVDENLVSITLSYDSAVAPASTTATSSIYSLPSSAFAISFSPAGGTAFTASSSGALTIDVVIDSASDSISLLNPGVWSFVILDPTGTGLSSPLLPTTSAALAAIGIPSSTTYSYSGLTTVGDEPAFVAIAVPEPSVFLFGGLVCSVLGFRGMARKILRG